MRPTALLILLALAAPAGAWPVPARPDAVTPPIAPATTPALPYGQLPSERVCEACYQQCAAERRRLDALLSLFEPDYWQAQSEGRPHVVGGGWLRERLRAERAEVDRLAQVWHAAWWVRWPPASEEQREEWAGVLAGLIGEDAFWRGEMPLPPGYR